jgi:hypothetical protein
MWTSHELPLLLQSFAHPPAPLSAAILIQWIGVAFSVLLDTRGKSNNQNYEMADAALSAFSIFFTQSQSFLDN